MIESNLPPPLIVGGLNSHSIQCAFSPQESPPQNRTSIRAAIFAPPYRIIDHIAYKIQLQDKKVHTLCIIFLTLT